MIKKLRLREDYDQRLNYFVKQYGEGTIKAVYFDYILFDEYDNDMDDEMWTDQSVNVLNLSYSTNENKLRNSLLNYIESDFLDYFSLTIPNNVVKEQTYALPDVLCTSIKFDVDEECVDYYDIEINFENLGDCGIEYNDNGEYRINAFYGFEINGKRIRGKDLALLLDIEYFE